MKSLEKQSKKELCLRCSSLPRVMRCPFSAFRTKEFDDSNYNANVGNLAHECIARVIMDDSPEQINDIINDVIRLNMVKDVNVIKNVRRHVWSMKTIWLDICSILDEMQLERRFVAVEHNGIYKSDKLTLTGTCDVVVEDQNGDLIIIDWKTGNEDDCIDQLLGYAWIHLNNTKANKVTVIAAYSDTGNYYTYIYERDIVKVWYNKLCDRVKSDVANPDTHCKYCPILLSCERYRKFMKNISDIAIEFNPDDRNIFNLRSQLDLISNDTTGLKKKIDKACKTLLAVDGSICIDGREYELQEQSRRNVKLNRHVRLIIKDHNVNAEDILLNNVSISESKIRKLDYGKKIWDELESSGLINETSFDKIQVKKGK